MSSEDDVSLSSQDSKKGKTSDNYADMSSDEEVSNENNDNNDNNANSDRKRVYGDVSSEEDDNEDQQNYAKRKAKHNIGDTSSDEEEDDHSLSDHNSQKAKAKDIFGEMSSEEDDDKHDKRESDNDLAKDSSDDEMGKNENEGNNEELNENEDNVEDNNEDNNEDNAEENGEIANKDVSFAEDEPQEEEEVIPETRIEVEIPRIVADLGKEMHFVKLPNFLSIDTHPYDPQWYEDEIDEDEVLDDEGRARLKLKVENTIRWRNIYDSGELVKESNARVVRWSDGSLSLHLGDEIFDIHKLHLMPGDNNHLFVRQGTGIQGQSVFRTKLTFRPFSTESFTHRKLTLSLADRSQKTQKIRVLPNVGKDPEAHRSEMIKKEEDRLKASIRRENKMRRVRERSLIRGPTASYLEPDVEDDDEEEGISISKIKNQYKRGSAYNKYQDEVDSGEEVKQTNEDDDSDLDIFDKRKTSGDAKKKSTQIVESDEED